VGLTEVTKGGSPALVAHSMGAPVPNPALVVLSPAAGALGDELRAALPAIKLGGPYAGLRGATTRPYQALAAELAGNAPWQRHAPMIPPPRPPLPSLAGAPGSAARSAVTLPLPATRSLIGF
jgi:hypothetical protein